VEEVAKISDITSLRISSNEITDIKPLHGYLSQLLTEPSALRWIDISYNKIPNGLESLQSFNELTVLYMHSNGIRKFSDVQPLSQLPSLRNLTLHGNPISSRVYKSKNFYRNYIIQMLPQLHKLDFSGITHQDRVDSETWGMFFRKRLKNGKKQEEEDY
jgi:hypothetical protein